MAYNHVNDVRNKYLSVFRLQLVLGLTAFLIISGVYRNIAASIAAGLGVVLALLPALLYIIIVWNSQNISAAKVFAQHKKAMLTKFISNLALFILVSAAYHDAYFLVLFITYIITLTGSWLCLVTD